MAAGFVPEAGRVTAENRIAAMKNLLIIRHAKSSWDDPALADFDRPLNKRGKQDAPFMGGLLKDRGLRPERIVSSPAKRASKTAKLIAEAVGYPAQSIDFRQDLYLPDLPALIEIVRAFDDAWGRVFLVGHNPGLTELCNLLTGEQIANIPTSGIASIEFEVGSWSHLMAGAGRLAFFDYPKRHRSPLDGQ